MIVVDVNLLLYAYDGRATPHDRARLWWQSVISGPELIGLPWQTIHAFCASPRTRESPVIK